LTTTQDDGATSYFEYDEKNQLTGMVDAEQGLLMLTMPWA